MTATASGVFRLMDARKRKQQLESFFRRFGAVYPEVGRILIDCPKETGIEQCHFMKSPWRPHRDGTFNELREKEALDRWVIDFHNALSEYRKIRDSLSPEERSLYGE